MEINCIVIDDEPLALDLIASYLRKIPGLNLKGAFHRATDALQSIRQDDIHLIYLDINMPDITGMEFLKSLENPPRVIFITAYDEFAIQGFEVNAVDYLLKPVPFPRFLKATQRAAEIINKQDTRNPEYILVKSEHTVLKVSLNTIHFIESYKDYLKIHTNDTHPILTISTFKTIEEILPSSFLRIHRSYLISIDKVISFRNGKVNVKDKYLPIGESYKDLFNERFVNGKLG